MLVLSLSLFMQITNPCVDALVVFSDKSSIEALSPYRKNFFIDGNPAALIRINLNNRSLSSVMDLPGFQSLHVPSKSDRQDGFLSLEEHDLLKRLFSNPSPELDEGILSNLKGQYPLNRIEGWEFYPFDKFGDPNAYNENTFETARVSARNSIRSIARSRSMRVVTEGILSALFGVANRVPAFHFAVGFKNTADPNIIEVGYFIIKQDGYWQHFETHSLRP